VFDNLLNFISFDTLYTSICTSDKPCPNIQKIDFVEQWSGLKRHGKTPTAHVLASTFAKPNKNIKL
jgi:hypothetical protein